MSLRAQRLRARLTGAVNRTLSMVYGGSLRRDVRRSFVAVERLEERIVFGNGGVGAHNPPYPLASCSDPSNTSTCQTCPPPPIAAGPGTGGPGHGGPGSSGPGGPSGASGPSGAGPGNGSGNGNGTGKTPILISVGIDNSAPSGSAGTEAPINAFGGMPRISSTDLQSNAFGLNWGISRSWIGMNDTGPIGNGWAIGEMPYLSVDDTLASYNGGVITDTPDTLITVVAGGQSTYSFRVPDPNSADPNLYASYGSMTGQQFSLVRGTDNGANVLLFTDSAGNVTEFRDVPRALGQGRPQAFDPGPTVQYGQFLKYTAVNGTTVTAHYDNPNNPAQMTSQVITNPATPSSNTTFTYSYSTITNDLVTGAGGTPPQLITSITMQQNGQTDRQAIYDFYTGRLNDPNHPGSFINDPNGRLGDLRTVTIEDGSGNVINQNYYRYYKLTGDQYTPPAPTPGNDPNTTGGPDPLQPQLMAGSNPYADNMVFSGLKTVVQGAEFDRLAAAIPNYQTAPDSGTGGIQPYVSNFFNYERWDDQGGTNGLVGYGAPGYSGGNDIRWVEAYRLNTRYRAIEEIAQGSGCSSCSGGQGTYKYEYALNDNDVTASNGDPGYGYDIIHYGTWRMKTTEYLPDDTSNTWADNNREVFYTNEIGQPLVDVHVQMASTQAAITAMSSTASGGDATVTVTVTANNSFHSGQWIALTGILPELYNGVFQITGASSTSFTFTLPKTYFGHATTAHIPPVPYVNTTTPSPGSVVVPVGTATLVANQWVMFYKYDDGGHLIQKTQPSADGSALYEDTYFDPSNSGSDISNNAGVVNDYLYAGWQFNGRSGITRLGSAVAPGSTPIFPPGDTNAGFVEDISTLSQSFMVNSAGSWTLNFKIADPSNATQKVIVYVDGAAQTTITPTTSFQSYSISPFLNPGLHTVTFGGGGVSFGNDGAGAALIADVSFSGSGSPTILDGNFGALSLAASSYKYDPAPYSISGTSGTGGDVSGDLKETFVQQGKFGTPIPQESFTYYAFTGGPSPIYPIASDTVYGQTGSGDPRTTNYQYSFYSGTNQLQTETVIAPPITTSQNGPASSITDTANADTTTFDFDQYGQYFWTKDADGYLSYTQFDLATGGTVETIQDVNTADTGDFTGLPAGWTTPSGGGLELKTLFQVDALGRSTLITDPNGNQTYMVYLDGHAAGSGGFVNQIRVYPGWHQIPNTSTYTTTGPVQVTREYRPAAGAPAGQQTVYDETLTFTAPVESTSTPSGTESIDQTNIQSLSRDQTNNAGQLIETDAYSSLSGLTYSAAAALLAGAVKADNTQAGNYSPTILAYDSRGRLDKTIDPNGTIYRTVYDDLSRVISRWVGTDDTPASGFWSPTNNTAPSNMVDVEDDVYDNGGVGDSNLTQVATHVDNSPADDRVTLNLYDWRDRLIATKQGALMSGGSNNLAGETGSGVHRLLTFFNLDNLGEVLGTYTYAADGLSLGDFSNWTTATDASSLRQLNTSLFDDQGRVYQSLQYSVDPTNGTIGSNLVTSFFFNHRGLTIETSNPGGLVYKHAYDGAARDIKDSTTDGGVINGAAQNWSNAGTTASDVVIEQTLNSYDPASNMTETEQRQRFNTDPSTAVGDLAGPGGGNLASRDYFGASYFDAANRQTDSVNVGTNGGSAWTRPSALPTGSNTVLVNHTDYDVAGRVLDTIDPRGIRSGTFYDMLGRTIETIGAWDGTQNPTPTNSINQITQDTYDGNGDVLTMTAVQPTGGSTPNQVTGYVLGVGATIGSDLFSKDLIGAVEYPDPTTGQPSSSAEEQFGYNWQGQKTSYTMRDATAHAYLYDVLARLTADYVTSFGGNTDQTIKRLGYSFNDAGLPFQQTSYSDAAGATIANQVQDAYNGYQQLTDEYQGHSGAIVVGTTPEVQYVYSQPTGANYSRMTAMVYPNAKQLDYNYTTTLDSAISRVDQLADHAGTYAGNDQSYLYLGLSTIVQQTDGNGIELTYIKQSGEPNGDAGDQYTGLDRFGRVDDQRWITVSNPNSPVDRSQYGYDQGGNVLYKDNLVNGSFSELYHANSTTGGDNATAYDPLNRLTAFRRGVLSASGHNGTGLDTISSPSATNSWSLDALGNWTATQNGTQTRTFNAQNQITGVSGQSAPIYDNGDMVSDPSANRSFYDAWNRMVYADTQGFSTSTYDALGRKIHEGSANLDLYYSTAGNVVEEQSGGSMIRQYVWGLGYVNNLVLQDAQGTRSYVHQDANWNVTSVTNISATVVQRMVYDPYGSVTYLTAAWGSGSNVVGLQYSFQGGRIEGSYIHFGARDYNPSLGVWMQPEPSGGAYTDGANLVQIDRGDPVKVTDPSGHEGGVIVVPDPGGGQVIVNPWGPPYFEHIPPPVAPPAPAPPPVPTTPAAELSYMKRLAHQFAQGDGMWSWNNQCDDQSAALEAYIRDHFAKDFHRFPHYWNVDTTGGAANYWAIVIRHNVVELQPRNGNPLPPTILDAFHGPQRPFNTKCKCETLSKFRSQYPSPVNTPSVWSRIWSWIVK